MSSSQNLNLDKNELNSIIFESNRKCKANYVQIKAWSSLKNIVKRNIVVDLATVS